MLKSFRRGLLNGVLVALLIAPGVAAAQEAAKLSKQQSPSAKAMASSTIRVNFSNATDGAVRFFLNGGKGLETQLEAGKAGEYTMAVDAGVQPTVKIYQVNGKNRAFTVADGGRYVFHVKDGEIINFLASTPEAAKMTDGERQALSAEAKRLWEEAAVLDQKGKVKEAVAVGEKMLETDRRLVGNDHWEIAYVLEWLAARYEPLEEFAAAKRARSEALENKTKRLGKNHWQVTDARIALKDSERLSQFTPAQRRQIEEARKSSNEAAGLASQGNYAGAIAPAANAVSLLTPILGADHPETAANLSQLAYLYKATGDYAKAEPLYQQALETHKKVVGLNHPNTAAVINNLGALCLASREFSKAEPLCKEALELRTKVLGAEHADTANSLHNLASLYLETREFDKAEPLCRKAVEINTKVLGDEHPATANSFYLLGYLYEATGNPDKAAPVYERVLAIRRKALGENHPATVTVAKIVNRLYQTLGNDNKTQSPAKEKLQAESAQLLAEARRMDQEGKFAEAIEAAKRMLEVERRIHSDQAEYEGIDLAMTAWIAEMFEKLDDFASAKSARQRVLDGWIRALGEQHWRVVDARLALNNTEFLAGLHDVQRRQLRAAGEKMIQSVRFYEAGKYSKALGLSEEAADVQKVILGPAHSAYARTLGNMAACFAKIGQYVQAETLQNQVVEIETNVLGARHPSLATTLNNAASVYLMMGNFAKAEELCRQSTAITKESLGNQHPGYAACLHTQGFVYKAMGEYQKAEPIYREALRIRKAALGEEHADYAVTLNNLAVLYRNTGDYQRAEPLFLEALAIRKRVLGETHPDYAQSLDNLGTFYSAVGDYERAKNLHMQAALAYKASVGADHPDYGISLGNVAQACIYLREYDKAEQILLLSLDINRKALGETHATVATTLGSLGELCRATGDARGAERFLVEQLRIDETALGKAHPNYAIDLVQLGQLYQSQENFAKAESTYREALKTSRKNLELVSMVQSERQQLAMLASVRNQLDAMVSLAIQAPQFASTAYDSVLAFKGLVLGRQRAMRAAARRAEVAPILGQLQAVASKLATLSFATPSPEQQQSWRQTIARLSSEEERLEQELAAASREYRDALQEGSLPNLQAALPERGAVVDFLQFTRNFQKTKEQEGRPQNVQHFGAFVVRKEGEPKFIDLGPATEIVEAIDLWRSGHGLAKAALDAGQTLREKIWLPIEPHLDGATTVLICPDRDIGKLPIGALPGKLPGTYLIQERILAVIPTPQAVVWLHEGRAGTALTDGILVVGGVDYERAMKASTASGVQLMTRGTAPRDERAAAGAFDPLPGTQGELLSVGGLYRETHAGAAATLVSGAEASQSAVAGALTNHQYAHLATHGYFAAERFQSAMNRGMSNVETRFVSEQSVSGYHPGLLSGLALAGANGPTDEDDGILTASEVESLNLGKVDLVVLSACETGLGRTAGGEGLLGLQRAFQVAGAQSVVASLWSVPDEATKMLMVRFYENLWKKKMGKLEALREAQLWMLEHGVEQPEMKRELAARGIERTKASGEVRTDGRLPPYYWGAWVLSGDWR